MLTDQISEEATEAARVVFDKYGVTYDDASLDSLRDYIIQQLGLNFSKDYR